VQVGRHRTSGTSRRLAHLPLSVIARRDLTSRGNSKGFQGGFEKAWIQMLLFDFLIGNSDRHQSNWAILIKPSFDKKKISFRVRWSPLYDNGSSLCCFINNEELNQLLGKDKERFEALVDSKSRSRIRIDGFRKKRPLIERL
jgi:hypothetical protein